MTGSVWLDRNRNGEKDAGEGLAGVEVTLSESVNIRGPLGSWTAITDAEGRYEFSGVPEGSYTLTVHDPHGRVPTISRGVTVTAGATELPPLIYFWIWLPNVTIR